MEKPDLPHAAGRPVHISIPAKLAFDLVAMQKATASILGRLGCPACHSGFDLRWSIEDRFHIDADLRVHDVVGGRLG